jgi:GTP-binding protein
LPDDPSEAADLTPIFDAIINDIPAPAVQAEGGLQMLVTALQYDSFLGKYAIGRIARGVARRAQLVSLIKNGEPKSARIDKIFTYRGLQREEADQAIAGDIVALTGITDAHIGDTVADKDAPEALPTIAIEAPTLSMYLGPNTSPFKGKEGEFTTSRQIGDRLNKELETNVALRVEEQGIGFKISGRGELHLSVLIEAMRREGYEFEVGRPQVVTITEDGVEKEPVEELQIEVGPEFVGAVSQELGVRRATMLRQEQTSSATARMTYVLPTRAMIGLRNQLLTATKGTVIMNSLPHGYEALGTQLQQTRNGVLLAFEAGTTTPYALENAESRGELFVGPAVEVYAGQIVGLNTRQEDMEINVCKAKHLTNMRSKSSDGTVQLTPFTDLSLEQCIDFIEDDELLEVTPKALRLRKRYLDANERKRAAK